MMQTQTEILSQIVTSCNTDVRAGSAVSDPDLSVSRCILGILSAVIWTRGVSGVSLHDCETSLRTYLNSMQ